MHQQALWPSPAFRNAKVEPSPTATSKDQSISKLRDGRLSSTHPTTFNITQTLTRLSTNTENCLAAVKPTIPSGQNSTLGCQTTPVLLVTFSPPPTKGHLFLIATHLTNMRPNNLARVPTLPPLATGPGPVALRHPPRGHPTILNHHGPEVGARMQWLPPNNEANPQGNRLRRKLSHRIAAGHEYS
jgi:hypothetical protein